MTRSSLYCEQLVYYTYNVVLNQIGKHYQLILSGDAVPVPCPHELVVYRHRELTVTELAYIREHSEDEAAHKWIARRLTVLPQMAYCIEEACRRALETRAAFPLMLHYGGVSCVILSKARAEAIAKNAIKNGGIDYCSSLYSYLRK